LRFGIEKSRNLMTVRLANDMGMPRRDIKRPSLPCEQCI
jgi:membrane carboxypeptidase/penicillin-binding protein